MQKVIIEDQKTDTKAQALDTSRFQLYMYNIGYGGVRSSANLVKVETMT